MKSILLALAVAGGLAASPSVAATCAPAKLTKIVTRSVGADVVPGSFRAQPVTLYRKGDRFMRSEEAPDLAQKQHLLIVANEPDIWFVNRMDKTGRHIVDPGPSLDVHAPIVTGDTVPRPFLDLEFGCEAAFAKARGREGGTRLVAGRPAKIWAFVIGIRRVEILLSAREEPVEVAYYEGEKTRMVLRYDVFQALPDDPSLFRRPEGITYREAGPQR